MIHRMEFKNDFTLMDLIIIVLENKYFFIPCTFNVIYIFPNSL